MYLISKKIRINQLFNYGFEQSENEQYYIRYIYEENDIEKEREESGYGYKTLYVDKKTRELFAYNDYNDERIPITYIGITCSIYEMAKNVLMQNL